jgi:uncharacterized protein (TIGR02246 family)
MMRVITTACLLICFGPGSSFAGDRTTRMIDRDVWSVVSRTVAESDIVGMANTYHPDAVLVGEDGTVPIAEQLTKWGRDMQEARQAGTTASVSFRFTSRRDDKKTAFEAGIFKYSVTGPSGEQTSSYIRFEALLVKKGGKWLTVMERQLGAVDEATWAAVK